MTWRWVLRGNQYFSSSTWAAIRFQPILYLFIFGAGIRLAKNPDEPSNFATVITTNIYWVWLSLMIGSPVLSLMSWIAIEKRSGRTRFMGMWSRLAADIGMLTTLVTFHAAEALTRNEGESHLLSRYIVAATIMFVFSLIIRDVWTLIVMERLAGQIHRSGDD